MARIFGNAQVAQGKRSFTRLRLNVPATLVLPHGRHACTIDNVSVSGARVRCDVPLRVGNSLELRFDRHCMFATVSWTRGIQAGLAFSDYLDQDAMRRLLWIVENRNDWDAQREANGARSWSSGKDTHKI
jgi:hypothetical protein